MDSLKEYIQSIKFFRRVRQRDVLAYSINLGTYKCVIETNFFCHIFKTDPNVIDGETINAYLFSDDMQDQNESSYTGAQLFRVVKDSDELKHDEMVSKCFFVEEKKKLYEKYNLKIVKFETSNGGFYIAVETCRNGNQSRNDIEYVVESK